METLRFTMFFTSIRGVSFSPLKILNTFSICATFPGHDLRRTLAILVLNFHRDMTSPYHFQVPNDMWQKRYSIVFKTSNSRYFMTKMNGTEFLLLTWRI